MKCKICGEELDSITFSHTINGGVVAWLNNTVRTFLYVCHNEKCKNFGIVVASVQS